MATSTSWSCANGRAVGANAFALPSGIVVMTDELVELAKTDDELVAVLAHEIGHVRGRHALRQTAAGGGRLRHRRRVARRRELHLRRAERRSGRCCTPRHSREFETEADAFAQPVAAASTASRNRVSTPSCAASPVEDEGGGTADSTSSRRILPTGRARAVALAEPDSRNSAQLIESLPRGAAPVEQLLDVDRIELVGLLAELAGDGARALLRDHRAHFVDAQRTQHVGDALARAAAFEFHVVARRTRALRRRRTCRTRRCSTSSSSSSPRVERRHGVDRPSSRRHRARPDRPAPACRPHRECVAPACRRPRRHSPPAARASATAPTAGNRLRAIRPANCR